MLQFMYLLQRHPQKKGVSPTVEKIKIKPVKHASFVNHLCYIRPVGNVHNVAQNILVGGGPPRVQDQK